MSVVFYILAVIFGLLTLSSLMLGLAGMSKPNAFFERYGNKLMRGRVLFQALTIVALFAAVAA